eukprot:4925954-Pleurochrysis_carterae.AAC.3
MSLENKLMESAYYRDQPLQQPDAFPSLKEQTDAFGNNAPLRWPADRGSRTPARQVQSAALKAGAVLNQHIIQNDKSSSGAMEFAARAFNTAHWATMPQWTRDSSVDFE